jgi:UDP-N-acetyl-D-mannosaminuronate dehydrogenase
MKNVAIIGLGEIGRAIKQIETDSKNIVNYFTEDDAEYNNEKIDVMHICIPYSESFENIVINYVNKYLPKLTIIHSTVKPGTTLSIKNKSKVPVVHSPVRGIHPILYDSIKTFEKLVGGDDEDSKLAIEHLKSIGINAIRLGSANDTEMAKIISTTYYGHNILFAKMVNEICNKYNYDFKRIYTIPNKSYNDGYIKLNMPHVVRPTLYPPTGIIGGHCITENFELLPETRLKKIMKELNESAE